MGISRIMFNSDVCSNHYLNRYVKFINSCKDQNIEKFYEKHHIIPKSLGGTNDNTNLINLTYRQHFIAHLILSKIFTGQSKKKMMHAVWNMVNRDDGKRTNSRTYEILRQQRVKFLSEEMKGEKNPMFGKRHSEEHKKKLSEKQKGKKKPESQRQKLSIRNSGAGNPQYGKPKTEKQIKAIRETMLINNPMFNPETVEKIRKQKEGTINCYDLLENKYVRITRELFLQEKNKRYVGNNSGLIKRMKND